MVPAGQALHSTFVHAAGSVIVTAVGVVRVGLEGELQAP